MPKAKEPHREEPPNQSAPNPDATKVATNPGTLTPVTMATTNNTKFSSLGWFTTNTEGCIVRFGIEQERYLLAVTLPNYNALFSQLLACWLNGCKVSLTYRLPIKFPTPDPNAPLSIVSLTALPPGSEG